MKKFVVLLLSFVLCITFTSSFTGARENNNIRIISTTEVAEGTEYIVPDSELIGTNLEDKKVVVTNNEVFIDNKNVTRGPGSVAVFIAGILAAYLIDGVLIYTTGYSGGELVASALQSLKSAYRSYPTMISAYFVNRMSALQSFKTSNGNECVRTSNQTFACKYSV